MYMRKPNISLKKLKKNSVALSNLGIKMGESWVWVIFHEDNSRALPFIWCWVVSSIQGSLMFR